MKKLLIAFMVICTLIVSFGIYNYLKTEEMINKAYSDGALFGCVATYEHATEESIKLCEDLLGE